MTLVYVSSGKVTQTYSTIFSRFTLIAECMKILFILWVNIIVCIYHTLLTCSSVGGHLGSFQLFALLNNSYIKTRVQVMKSLLSSLYLGLLLEMKSLDPRIRFYWIL